MHTHRYFFLLQPVFYLLCLLGLSSQPLYADSYRCPLAHLTADVPVALVIANSQYENRRLWQSVNDAEAMSNVLKKLDFQVIFKTELNEKAMNQAIAEFSHCLQITGGVGLFYFTGYGVQVKAANYLLPINAGIKDETDVEFDAYPVNKILARLKKSKNASNIMILDASRDNPSLPFSSRGLASMSSPSDFFIGYPIEPGQIVDKNIWTINSLYIKALIKALETAKQKHTRIEDVFMQVTNAVEQESQGQQVPQFYSSLIEKFCFGGCPDVAFSKGKKAYEKGYYTTALKWFRQAAELGHADAQKHLGVMYAKGEGIIQNDLEAVKWFQKAAKQRFAKAQFNIGVMYANGKGVTQNNREAVKWFQKAAKQGFAPAQNALGWAYADGRGVIQNDREAVKWFQKAAEMGDAKAQTILGVMYADGRGVTQNDREAVQWYQKAAEQEFAPAQYNLGWAYAKGRGVTQNDREAVKWFKKAAEQGEASAQNNLGVRYLRGRGVAKNDREAVKWYQKSAEQGNATAQYNLGFMYDEGRGVAKNVREAVKWYQKAAEQGDAEAQYTLGMMYAKGRGVAQNYLEAVKWYQKATEQGHAKAQARLRELSRP